MEDEPVAIKIEQPDEEIGSLLPENDEEPIALTKEIPLVKNEPPSDETDTILSESMDDDPVVIKAEEPDDEICLIIAENRNESLALTVTADITKFVVYFSKTMVETIV